MSLQFTEQTQISSRDCGIGLQPTSRDREGADGGEAPQNRGLHIVA